MTDPQNKSNLRRLSFIGDIVQVCKKHRVMIDLGDPEASYDLSFIEHSNSSEGCSFMVTSGALEESVRMEVWDTVNSTVQTSKETNLKERVSELEASVKALEPLKNLLPRK